MLTLVLATRNAHKTGEIQAILGSGFRCCSLRDFPHAPMIAEDANTFEGNATCKAVKLARWVSTHARPELGSGAKNMFVLADDSGLEVDALHGAPGVHSARFAASDTGAAGNSPDAENNAKLLRLLADVPEARRTARFRCVLALTPLARVEESSSSPVCAADEFELLTRLFQGKCEGRIALAPRGGGGFGYDPLFVPEGFETSFGELGEDIKNKLSHRAKALKELKRGLAAEV